MKKHFLDLAMIVLVLSVTLVLGACGGGGETDDKDDKDQAPTIQQIKDSARDYVLGDKTDLESGDGISPAGVWYEFTLAENTFVILYLDASVPNSSLEDYRYFAAQVYKEDLTTVVLSGDNSVKTLEAGTYYVKLYSSNSRYYTDGRIQIENIAEFAEITEDEKFTSDYYLGSRGTDAYYFNNTADGEFTVTQSAQLDSGFDYTGDDIVLIIRNSSNEQMLMLTGTDPENVTLPAGQYIVEQYCTDINLIVNNIAGDLTITRYENEGM